MSTFDDTLEHCGILRKIIPILNIFVIYKKKLVAHEGEIVNLLNKESTDQI
jgi:hypothetical protein